MGVLESRERYSSTLSLIRKVALVLILIHLRTHQIIHSIRLTLCTIAIPHIITQMRYLRKLRRLQQLSLTLLSLSLTVLSLLLTHHMSLFGSRICPSRPYYGLNVGVAGD